MLATGVTTAGSAAAVETVSGADTVGADTVGDDSVDATVDDDPIDAGAVDDEAIDRSLCGPAAETVLWPVAVATEAAAAITITAVRANA